MQRKLSISEMLQWLYKLSNFLFQGIISAILTKCSKEEGFIPINKNLW